MDSWLDRAPEFINKLFHLLDLLAVGMAMFALLVLGALSLIAFDNSAWPTLIISTGPL